MDLVLNVKSNEALLLAGHAYIEQGINSSDFGAVCMNIAHVYKVSAHDKNLQLYCKAMAGENTAQWHQAMVDEMNSLKSNGTWHAVYLPAGRKAIGSHWVVKVKHLPNSTIECFKT